MALRAINPDAVREYISRRDCEVSTHDMTLFSLRTLTAAELADIHDATQEVLMTGDGRRGITINLNRRNWLLVQTALAGWQNFRDECGNPITFAASRDGFVRPRASSSSVDILPFWLVRELAAEIVRDST